MRRRKAEPARPWVHLDGPRLFDQTNGAVAYESEGAAVQVRDDARDLLEKGVVANTVTVGPGGF